MLCPMFFVFFIPEVRLSSRIKVARYRMLHSSLEPHRRYPVDFAITERSHPQGGAGFLQGRKKAGEVWRKWVIDVRQWE